MAGRPRRGVGLREAARGWRWGGRPLVPAGAEEHRVPDSPREFPTAWARRPVSRATRGAFLSGAMNPLLHLTLTASTHGTEAFDEVRDTPVIIVSNHSSHLDAPMLLCALPGRVRSKTAVTAAADYFFESAWRGFSSALAFATVPIERRGGAASTTPVNLLRDGWNLVIFPEGTRSRDGARGRFRLGAAYLAINAGVPVVPVGVRGAFAAMPRGRSWPVPGRPQVTVRFGRPMRPGPGEDVRTFTARLAAEVDRLCAEDATSWWDSTRAAARPVTGTVPSPAAAGDDAASDADAAHGADAASDVDAASGAGSAGANGAAVDGVSGVSAVDGVGPDSGRGALAMSRFAAAGRGADGAADSSAGDLSAGDLPVPGPSTSASAGAGGTAPAARRAVRSPRTGAAGSGSAAGSPAAISARLRGAPGTPAARWRRIWEATEPTPRSRSRSPWKR